MWYNNDPEHEDYGLVYWGRWFRLYFIKHDYRLGVEYIPREDTDWNGYDIPPRIALQVGPFYFLHEGESREILSNQRRD